MINLFQNYYRDKNVQRQGELDICLMRNFQNKLIDRIVLIATQEDILHIPEPILNSDNISKMYYSISEKRPTYNDLFILSHRYQDDINIVANSDICFDETIEKLIELSGKGFQRKNAFALSRWDILASMMEIIRIVYDDSKPIEFDMQLLDRPDSQDAWVFFGPAPVIHAATFTMGMAGCDNKIAYLLEANGYNVQNPSKDIRAVHFHSSNIRNYDADRDRKIIRPPFKTIWPTTIEQLKF